MNVGKDIKGAKSGSKFDSFYIQSSFKFEDPLLSFFGLYFLFLETNIWIIIHVKSIFYQPIERI